MAHISLRTARDIGLLLRDARKRANEDQASLAARIGVSRRWVVDAERGNAGAALGTILRALDAVGVHLAFVTTSPGSKQRAAVQQEPLTVDIDAIIDATRKRKR